MISAVSRATPALSREFYERIRIAYLYNVEGFGGSGDSMWSTITTWRSDIDEALRWDNPEEAVKLLTNPAQTKLYWGADDLYVRPTSPEKAEQERLASMAADALSKVAIALGIMRMPNPEGGTSYAGGAAPSPPSAETLLDKIDRKIGRMMNFPNPFPQEAGLATSRGIAAYRAVHAIYQAYCVKSLIGDNPAQNMLEIGAGVGRTAYYCRRIDVRNYTIVDLPLALVGQAVFLGLVLGENAVRFGNEPENGMDRIRLLSPAQLHNDQRRYHVVLNVDSMPEMDSTHVLEYFARMKRDKAKFLSINHEANTLTVQELAPKGAQLSRHPYLLRTGYLEERFDFQRT